MNIIRSPIGSLEFMQELNLRYVLVERKGDQCDFTLVHDEEVKANIERPGRLQGQDAGAQTVRGRGFLSA